jgi:hypothetical protein
MPRVNGFTSQFIDLKWDRIPRIAYLNHRLILLLTTAGSGRYLHKFRPGYLVSGRLSLLNCSGNVQLIDEPEAGYALIVSFQAFAEYIKRYPDQQNGELYDDENTESWVDLSGDELTVFKDLMEGLTNGCQPQQDAHLLIGYINEILFRSNYLYRCSKQVLT